MNRITGRAYAIMLVAAFFTILLSGCGEKAADSPASEPPALAQEPPKESTMPEIETYPGVEKVFCDFDENATIKISDKGTYLEVSVLRDDLSDEAEPEGWASILEEFEAALSSGKDAAEEYGFSELAAQLEAESGTILASGFSGAVKYDKFSEKNSATTLVLGPGQYTVGVDISAGTYDCRAASGFGVLRGTVAAYGELGFVQTMGSVSAAVGDDSVSIDAASSYSNLKLADGDVLYIEMNLNVEFLPK